MKKLLLLPILTAMVSIPAFAQETGTTIHPEYTAPLPVKVLTFDGELSLSNATGWVKGTLSTPANAALLSGDTFAMRANQSGDIVVLKMIAAQKKEEHTGHRPVTSQVDLLLSELTVSYVELFCGGKVSGVDFPSGAAIAPGHPISSISGQVLLLGTDGKPCIYAANEQSLDDSNPKIASNNKETKVSKQSSEESTHLAEVESSTKAI